jgi:hypothetical protein
MMNANHLHLRLNHAPVLEAAFGLGLLAFGMWRRRSELQKSALGVFVIAALVSVPVYLTGEPAEDGVEGLPGVSDVFIGNHESAASFAFSGILALGFIALSGLFLFRGGKVVSTMFATLALVGAIAVSVIMGWTANLGGQIRHTEIHPNATVPTAVQGKERY